MSAAGSDYSLRVTGAARWRPRTCAVRGQSAYLYDARVDGKGSCTRSLTVDGAMAKPSGHLMAYRSPSYASRPLATPFPTSRARVYRLPEGSRSFPPSFINAFQRGGPPGKSPDLVPAASRFARAADDAFDIDRDQTQLSRPRDHSAPHGKRAPASATVAGDPTTLLTARDDHSLVLRVESPARGGSPAA